MLFLPLSQSFYQKNQLEGVKLKIERLPLLTRQISTYLEMLKKKGVRVFRSHIAHT